MPIIWYIPSSRDATKGSVVLRVKKYTQARTGIHPFMPTLTPAKPRLIHNLAELADRTIGDYLSESLRLHSQRVALVCDDVRWTFAQLDAASSHIARRLLEEGDRSSEPVAVLLDKTPIFVACWLGVLRSGRILVSIDPSDPPARVRQLLEDAGARMVLSQEAQRGLLDQAGVPDLLVMNVDSTPTDAPAEFRAVEHGPSDPCILIYTSGSTGTPKGVVQIHRNLVVAALRTIVAFDYKAQDRIAHTANVGFVVSTMMLMGALGAGVEIHLYNVKRDGLQRIAESAVRERITCLHLTPTVMRAILEALPPGQKLDSLRVLRLAGEPLFRRDVEHFRKFVSRDCVLFNGYGCTEIAMSRYMPIPHDLQLDSEIVSAGHCLERVQVLLLDEDDRPVEPGEVGKICVHTPFIALGYWNRPEETREVFVPALNPSVEFGDRMYRTGDLGRIRPDGCLEVLGRRDQQVKIRGVRIETAEVERTLMRHPGVKLAVAVKCEFAPGDDRLVAFWTPSGEAEVTASELRDLVVSELPTALRPSLFLRREEFPLTPTGKINRATLSESARTERPERGIIAPAQSEAEFALREIWEEVLNIRPIGVTDHFFELGGHSLLAVRVIEEAAKRMGASIAPESFLRAPTIREMAREIESHESESGEQRIVTIHDAGEGIPLWVTGSHRMTFFEYAPLLELLPRDRPIRIVGPSLMDGGDRLLASVEDAAREVVELIRQTQPEGPMFLLGHCMGGLLAMEVARLLTDEGRAIERVIIIEPSALRRWLEPIKRIAAMWGALRSLSLEQQIELFLKLRASAVRMEARLRNWRQWLSPFSAASRAVKAVQNVSRTDLRETENSELMDSSVKRNRVARDATGATLMRLTGVALRGYHPVMRLYFPRAYSGRLAVIRAESSDVSQQPYAAWRREWEQFGRDQIEIRVLPGDHHSILQPPNVRALSEVLEVILSARK